MGYFLSYDAGHDLDDIATYTARNWGDAQYEKYTILILDGLDLVGDNPILKGSKDRSVIFRGCRSYKVGKHIIVYYDTGEVVEILRILHQSMDIRKQLQ